MELYEFTDALCSSLLTRFSDFIGNLKELQGYAKDFNSEDSFIQGTQESKRITFEAASLIAKIYVSLRFPGMNSKKFIKSYEYHEQYICQISKKSNDTVELFKKICEKQDKKLRDDPLNSLQSFKQSVEHLTVKQEDFWQHHLDDKILIILNSNSGVTFKTVYDLLIENIKKLDDLKMELEGKRAVNTQTIFNHNIDHLYDFYSLSLLQYCEIMKICDEIYLIDYCLTKKFNNDNDCFSILKEINFDILAAEMMEKYLIIYQTYKTDFLLFIQTRYFRNKMLNRIIENLDNFIFLFELKEKDLDEKERKLNGLLEENEKNLNKMKKLRIQWGNFKDLYNSFNDFLKRTTAGKIHNENTSNNSEKIIEESNAEKNQELSVDEKDKNFDQIKEDKVTLQEEVTSSNNKSQSNDDHNKNRFEQESGKQPDKQNKIKEQSKPDKTDHFDNKNDEHAKISVQNNESENKKSYHLHYYIVGIAVFSLLFLGTIYFIISKYRIRSSY